MVRRDWNAVLTVSLLWAAACGGDAGERGAQVEVRDSAGVTIVSYGALDPDLRLEVSPEPALQIGVVDGAPDLQLFGVTDVKRLADGGVAVANGGSRELRIYNADGTVRASAGGAGDGPSEFRYPRALTLRAGDTIQVQDFLDRVFFTTSGDFIRRESVDRGSVASMAERVGGMSEGGQWLADGSFFAPVYMGSGDPPVAGPLYRPRMLLIRASADLATVHTLGEFGGILQQYVDVGGPRPSATVPPFPTNTSFELGAADGSIVIGDNAHPRVRRFSPDGSELIIRWTAEPEEVTEAEVQVWKERQRGADWAQSRLPELERGWAVMDVPERKPYYGSVAVGADGTVIVSTALDLATGGDALLFDRDGRYLGVAALPPSFRVFDAGPGWILGVRYDELGVEFVQLYTYETGS